MAATIGQDHSFSDWRPGSGLRGAFRMEEIASAHEDGLRPLSDLDESQVWAMVEASPDGMLLADEHGTILLVNAQIGTMFGYDRGDLLGRPVEELLPEQHRQVHTAHRTRYRAEPKIRAMASGLDLRARRSDGTEFPVEVSLSPVTDPEGLQVVATVRDISGRVAVEAHAHAVLHTIDETRDGVFMFTPDTLQFSYVNHGAVSQLGYSADELSRMTPIHIKPEFTETTFRAMLAPLLAGEVDSHVFTTLHRRKDGNDFPVEIILQYPPPADVGQPQMLVALVRDISQRVEAAQQLEAARDRQQRWLEGLAAIRTCILDDAPVCEALQLVCHHAAGLVDADMAAIGSPDQERAFIDLTAMEGGLDDHLDEPRIPIGSGLRTVLETKEPALFEARPPEGAAAFITAEVGPTIVVPLTTDGDLAGVLLLARKPGEPAFTDEDLKLIESFAHQANNALERARARDDRQRLVVLEDRERLARDLHDLVIQRLFAAGMGLQSVQPLIADPKATERVDATVTQIDQTIAELRAAIFKLNNPSPVTVATQLDDIIRHAEQSLGFRPSLAMNGDPETITGQVAEQLLPTLTEALSNVARHANATTADINITLGNIVQLDVVDDGDGYQPSGTNDGNGLNNLLDRAQHLNGTMVIAANPDGGTTFSWTASN